MNNEVWTQILLAVISIIGALITGVLIPYLKTKTTKAQREDVEYWTGIAIQAVEKYYEGQPQKGQVKKEFVMDFMTEHGYDISDEQMTLLIDALVEELINKPKEEFIK